ncbi:MAG: FtsW/RodA/SpoVE family cell cycle protein [Clostridia bacterium]|nr:FtsW/RodA/SpoVE family cell cycle protein [Clostridia bacterium]
MITESKKTRAHISKTLLVLTYTLAILGIYFVAVATYSPSSTSGASLLTHIAESSYAMRQGLYVLISPLVLAVMLSIKFELLRRWNVMLYWATLGLVTAVWVFNRATGVKQWLDVFMGYTIQPTEFAKLTIILRLASVLSKAERPLGTFKDAVMTIALVLIPGAIIVLSGETGSFIVIAFVFLVMIFFANTDWRVIALLITLVVLGLLALYGFAMATGSDNYRLLRIISFFRPEEFSSSSGYQQTQSMMAIGSGGLRGVGGFSDSSLYRLDYVPADWTDFIFSTIGEATGFIGCASLVLLYLFFILYMLRLAYYTRDRFGMLIVVGVAGMFFFHILENVGMTAGLLPITGIPLPFLSYGGSNMIMNMAAVGLVLNVTKNRSLTGNFSTPQLDTQLRHYTR